MVLSPHSPTLKVDVLTGSDMARVTATIDLVLSGLPPGYVDIEARVWGQDGGFNGEDDALLLFPRQTLNTLAYSPDRYTFSGVVPRAWLDEDNGNDEIYSSFNIVLKANNPQFNSNAFITSSILKGEFGID